MFLRTFLVGAPLVLGGVYVSGGLNSRDVWTREVGRSPTEVARAIEDLDITDQPGSPGTDPRRSGGVAPLFKVEKEGDRVRWLVMSGDKIATTMTALLTPLEGGKRTRVVAEVERGNAPDDFVSPAFRSEDITMGLFTAALEGELNELTKVAPSDPKNCAELFRRFQAGNIAAGTESRDLTDAFARTAKMAMRMQAIDAERRRLGCPENFGDADDYGPLFAGDGRSAPGPITPGSEMDALRSDDMPALGSVTPDEVIRLVEERLPPGRALPPEVKHEIHKRYGR